MQREDGTLPDYRRYRVPGGCYFFTVNLLERFPNDLLIRHVDLLRAVVRDVRRRWPFVIDGWVVLPDRLHCIWTLPVGDSDFANRWRLIKAGFARQLPKTERRSLVRTARGERGYLAAAFLGACDSRWTGLRIAHGLPAFQSGQAWLCPARGGSAVFEFRPVCREGALSG